MKLAEQWSEILAGFPQGWRSAGLSLTFDDEEAASRAAVLLGPAAPARAGASFRVDVARTAQPPAIAPELLRRMLVRLDSEGVGGRVAVVEAPVAIAEEREGAVREGGLAARWRALVDGLPDDWSHLLGQVDLDSSDYVERGALLMAPMNPQVDGGRNSLRFRSARTTGYGVSPEMAQRCFERLDRERITGLVWLVHVVSDARPVATQGGPVWRVSTPARR